MAEIQITSNVVNDSICARHYFEAERPAFRQMLVKVAKSREEQRLERDISIVNAGPIHSANTAGLRSEARMSQKRGQQRGEVRVTPLSSPDFIDVAVVGAGPAALAAALALATSGLRVALIGPAYDPGRAAQDRRTTALLPSSLEMLRNLGVWRLCAGHAARARRRAHCR